MKKWILTLMVVAALGAGCVSLPGCVKTTDEAGVHHYALDTEKVEQVEDVAQLASGVLTALGAIWPELLAIAAALGGALGTWKKMKPKLEEAQTTTKLYHTAGVLTALGIEEFKEQYPEEWAKLKDELDNVKGKMVSEEDLMRIKNVINGWRGLPPV